MAEAEQSKEGIPWTTIATVLLSIPVTCVTLIGSVWLIKKTRLENRKLELEIREKEIALADASASANGRDFVQLVADPLFEGRRVGEIILRAILLALILQSWRLGTLILSDLNPYGAYYTFYPRPNLWVTVPLYLLVLAIKIAPIVGYYVVLIGMGTSIGFDILRHLNVGIPKFVDRFRSHVKLWYLLLTVAIFLITGSRYYESANFVL